MHFILEKAKKYKPNNTINKHLEYEYSREGYWASVRDGSPLVNNENFVSLSTKKADVETGEDQKGE